MGAAPLTRREMVRLGIGLGGLACPLLSGSLHGAVAETDGESLQEILDQLLARHAVPGAVAGLYQSGRVSAAAAGTSNLNTGVPMTPNTAFLTGSITKVWTASLVMTFVDDGTIDLDRPVISYLPDFRVGDQAATRAITTRHLLNHSSGIDAGDYLLELGEGREAHRRYVEALASVGQIHAPGAYSSYCNGGFILAGWLLERLTDTDYAELLRQRLIEPLGLRRTVTDTDAAIMHRTAVGSVPDPGSPSGHRAASRFHLPKSAAPAGATLITTVADNLAFAAMHMRGGVAADGRRVLSESSVRAMATRTIGRPAGGGGYGLGWGVSGRPGSTRLSHSGGSNGGIAQLVALPEAGVGYAAFANSSASYGFHGELQQQVMATVLPAAGPAAAPAPVAAAPAKQGDAARMLGRYVRKSQVTTIRLEGRRIMVDVDTIPEEFQGSEAYLEGQARSFEVRPTAENALTSVEPVLLGQPATFVFLEPDPDGRFRLLYSAGRLSLLRR